MPYDVALNHVAFLYLALGRLEAAPRQLGVMRQVLMFKEAKELWMKREEKMLVVVSQKRKRSCTLPRAIKEMCRSGKSVSVKMHSVMKSKWKR